MMLSVIDTELWLSAVVETEVTVGAVVSVEVLELSVVVVELSEVLSSLEVVSSSEVVVLSLVVDAPSSLLLAQEMIVRLKRNMRIMYKTFFIFFLHQ